MLKFIKSFFQSSSNPDKVNNKTVKNNATSSEPKEKGKIVHKSSKIHKVNNISTDKKHKLLKSKEEVKTAHIYVHGKEEIIVKILQSNGLELENEGKKGKYSTKLLKHYLGEFSSLGYKTKIHNYITDKRSKQKITINKKSKKLLKEDQLQKSLGLYEIGVVQWFDDQLGYGFIKSRQNIDFFVHKRQLDNAKIVENDIVVFKCEKNEKGNYADKVLLLKNNKKSIFKFVEFNDKYRKINKDFFRSRSVKDICQVFFYSTYLNEISEESFINMMSSCASEHSIIQVIDHYVTKNKTISSSLYEVVLSNLTNDNSVYFLKSKNLNLFLENSELSEKLEKFPPFIKKKYEEWTNSINEAMNYYHVHVMHDPKVIYESLTDADYFLAKQWIDKSASNFNFEYAKMLSARGAELAALHFYKTLNFNVDDTAMSQINNSSQDWKLFDLLLDNTKSIDVKNSRGLINEKLSYSEYCIPRFKETRQKKQVAILGVLSPYLKLNDDEQILDAEISYGTSEIENSINILGEVTVETIEKLDAVFSNGKLDIDINKKNFVPDWLLEYPKEFYKEREDAKLFFKSTYIEHPAINEYKVLDVKAIPFFLSCGIDLPSSWAKVLTEHQLDFYNRLKAKCNIMITKPYLYLAILKHFIEKLQSNPAIKYQPSDYMQLLYYESEYKYPLGIYDPTLIIKKLVDTLNSLWVYRTQIDLEDYSTFKYTEKGILKAKKPMSLQWNTLLAYCGGFVDSKGSCGYKPLIKGPHETCSVCNYIICPKCDFCKKGCSGIEERCLNEQTYL